MIDVGRHGLVVDVALSEVASWLRPVVDAGRDAAFVDTGYIRALLDARDDRHSAVLAHHAGLSASLYTSALVVAEAARQFAKADAADQQWRWQRVEELRRTVTSNRRIVICAPPAETIRDALQLLEDMQRTITGLDLCDTVSMMVLDMLSHRRVLGFDRHFLAVGASLEP